MYCCNDKNNATNKKQLRRLLALNQLLNIAEYYNKLHSEDEYCQYCIALDVNYKYFIKSYYKADDLYGIYAFFNKEKDAQEVIDNSNFREILDTVYKN